MSQAAALGWLLSGFTLGAAFALTGLELWSNRAERRRQADLQRSRDAVAALASIDWNKVKGCGT